MTPYSEILAAAYERGKNAGYAAAKAEKPAEMIRLRRALAYSHELLRHYAAQLNLHDGGRRVIPDTLEDWLTRIDATQIPSR